MPPSISHTGSIADMLEPAIDGPPSPESLRALTNQVRRASAMDRQERQDRHPDRHLDRHANRQSHQTTSSGSSSLRSLTSADRPSWDHAFDTAPSSLSRQSSGRSISSSVQQPRDRHDSVQIFGRALFGKRNRLRRESSAQSSSNSSLYSAELSKNASASPPLPPATSHGLPNPGNTAANSLGPALSFFNRRRSTKSGLPGDESDGRRKLQISGPYNFQHLTHTQKDEVADPCASSMLPPPPLPPTAHGSQTGESLYFPDFSSNALSAADDMVLPSPARRLPMRQHAASVSSVMPRPRTLLHTMSEDQLRIPPPRPPRSPIDASSGFSPPPVPTRMSSRISMRYGQYDSLDSFPLDRPQTSGSFRPLVHASLSPKSPHRLIHAHSYSADMSVAFKPVDYHRGSQAGPSLSPQSPAGEDANWPLAGSPGPMTTPAASFGILPGVPEEEEHVINRSSMRKSRISVISNSSSLRGSQSVPLLRRLSQDHGSGSGTGARRPPSGASDTLGAFDTLASQRVLRPTCDVDAASALPKESWEDDIDYCYEHAVEADCEYAWERSSLEISREDLEDLNDASRSERGSGSSSSSSTQREEDGSVVSSTLSPASMDVPFLSAASQTSMASMNEAITPTGLVMRNPGLTIETSKPLADDGQLRPQFLHVRTSSRASSFKESHGFNLSPTFFIPGSDRYEVLPPAPRTRLGFAIGVDDDDETPSCSDNSSLYTSFRASASTTGSCESRDSVLSRRHISAASTATDLTRLTMSTASIEDLLKPEASTLPGAELVQAASAL